MPATVSAELIDELEGIEAMLYFLDDLELDCDGISDEVSRYLEGDGIAHKRMTGIVVDTVTREVVAPHCWIELESGAIVDFRLRKWLGDYDEIPHGAFVPTERFSYRGNEDTRERYVDRDLL